MTSSAQQLLPPHGVLINYLKKGVYLIGQSGVGKSETALSLIDSGAQLVCDDAPEFHIQDKQVIGTCPEKFYGLMHIRELGLVDIRRIKGEQHLRELQRIELVIELLHPVEDTFQGAKLNAEIKYWYFKNIPIPGISLSCGHCRNISLLIKTAIMQYALT